MPRHGLCSLETSQGKCMQDGRYCGWRVVGCALSSLWESFRFIIILIVVIATVVSAYSSFKKANTVPVKASLYWEAAPQEPIKVTVTGYSPTVEECDDTPFVTAFQKRVREGIIAISRDLEETHDWREGDLIHLEGLGVFEVGDRMNKRWKERVDIFFFKTKEARAFGKMQARAVKL